MNEKVQARVMAPAAQERGWRHNVPTAIRDQSAGSELQTAVHYTTADEDAKHSLVECEVREDGEDGGR